MMKQLSLENLTKALITLSINTQITKDIHIVTFYLEMHFPYLKTVLKTNEMFGGKARCTCADEWLVKVFTTGLLVGIVQVKIRQFI